MNTTIPRSTATRQEPANTPEPTTRLKPKLSVDIELPFLINGILFTLTIVLLQNLLGMSNLDILLTIALTLFSIALPCLGGYALVVYLIRKTNIDPQERTKAFLLFQGIGFLTDFMGIGIYIWHASQIAGPVFFVTSLTILIVCAITSNHISAIEIYRKMQKRRRALRAHHHITAMQDQDIIIG